MTSPAAANRAALDALLVRLGIDGEDRAIVVQSCVDDPACRRHWLGRIEQQDRDTAELELSRQWALA